MIGPRVIQAWQFCGRQWRLYLKGTSEILTKCIWHVTIGIDTGKHGTFDEEVETTEINDLASDNISQTIIFYANQTLQMIALCYCDFNPWPPYGTDSSMNDEVCQPYTLKILHIADLAILQI